MPTDTGQAPQLRLLLLVMVSIVRKVNTTAVMTVTVNHDKSTSNDASSGEGIEEDGGVDGKQTRGVVGKENPACG